MDTTTIVSYERGEIPYEPARRRRFGRRFVEATMGWPKGIDEVRRALPEHLWDAAPPATARAGSWAVVAKVGEQRVAFAWIIPMPCSTTECCAEEVSVLPAWQGRGIGPGCLVRVLAWMQELRYERVAILPLGWARTVERMGFTHQDHGIYVAAIADVTT